MTVQILLRYSLRSWRLIGVLAFFCLPTLAAHAARADVSDKDIKTLVKSVKFAEGDFGKDVAVIYASAAGDADQAVQQLSAQGYRATKIAAGSVDQASARIFLFVGDLNGFAERAYSRARQLKAISVSTNDACIPAKRCVMSIRTTPKVEIKIGQAAASESGVRFGAAFKMIAREY